MDYFFEQIVYGWLQFLYGQPLGNYLAGYHWDGTQWVLANQNLFGTIGLVTLFITALMCVSYYYIINHPRFNRFWSWLILLAANSVINMLLGFLWTNNDLISGKIEPELLYLTDPTTGIQVQQIFTSNCFGFGMANFFASAIFFIIISFIIKWWSSNCKYSPR